MMEKIGTVTEHGAASPEDIAKVDRWKQAILVTYLMIEELIDFGIIKGPKLLNEFGRSKANKLLNEGFKVTDREISAIMMHLHKKGRHI